MAKRKKTRQTIRYLMRKASRAKDVASQITIEWAGGKHVIVTRPWARFYLMDHLHLKIELAETRYPKALRKREYDLIRAMFADLKSYYQKPRLP